MSSLKFEIEELLLQIQGNFYKYDIIANEEIIIAANVFLSIVRVNKLDSLYLMNIVN